LNPIIGSSPGWIFAEGPDAVNQSSGQQFLLMEENLSVMFHFFRFEGTYYVNALAFTLRSNQPR
jgi:hypothetical protein